MLISVDGTSSRDWMRVRSDTHRFNSSVRNFSDDYVEDPTINPKKYFAGPDLLATDVPQIVQWGWEFALSNLRAQPGQAVNLVGHSRGGHIVTALAGLLDQFGWLKYTSEKEYPFACDAMSLAMGKYDRVLQERNVPDTLRSQRVNFLGLYDAVDRSYSFDTSKITSNVELVHHAVRDPHFGSRLYFGNTAREVAEDALGNVYGLPPVHYVEKIIMGSHGSIGGDPDGGDIKWFRQIGTVGFQNSVPPSALLECTTPVTTSAGPTVDIDYGPSRQTTLYQCDVDDEALKATLYAATANADAFIRAGASSTGIRFK